jgi:hypothetical protein
VGSNEHFGDLNCSLPSNDQFESPDCAFIPMLEGILTQTVRLNALLYLRFLMKHYLKIKIKGGHTTVVTLLLDYSEGGPGYFSQQHLNPIPAQNISPPSMLQGGHIQGQVDLSHNQQLINQEIHDERIQNGQIQTCELRRIPNKGEHGNTLDQLAKDAREAQVRLEALEAKIKHAFDQKQVNEVAGNGNKNPGEQEGLRNEIAQIQKEKAHKQKLMSELQKVKFPTFLNLPASHPTHS